LIKLENLDEKISGVVQGFTKTGNNPSYMADQERDDYPVCDEAVELGGAAHAAVSFSQLLGQGVYESAA
jgi:hypothetical protein